MLCVGRDTGSPKYYFFDKDFKFLCYSDDCLALSREEIDAFVKPEGYDELFEYASRLSAPFEFVRVDFYISKGQIIFGELTFTLCRAGYGYPAANRCIAWRDVDVATALIFTAPQ